MNKYVRVFIIAILIGLLFGLYFYFFQGSPRRQIVSSVLFSVNIGCLMMVFIYKRRFFLQRITRPLVGILLMMIGLVIVAIIGTELTLYLNSILFTRHYKPLSGGSVYFLNIAIVLVTGLPTYFNEELKDRIGDQVLKQQYELLQLNQLKILSDLETLRAKINPHFLYNVHNTIVGLIKDDPEKAETLTILLSKFFRFTLDKDSSTYHTVKDELEIVKTYLEMQKIRYSEKLDCVYEVDADTLNQRIPSFIIQPLVENAVKHGIEQSVKQGYIGLKIFQDKESITIRVKDSGPGFPESFNPGVGQKLIINKLNLLCKDRYGFIFQNSPEKYVEVKLYPDEYSHNS
jgi:two-component system LytT family sensor kinase